MFVYNAAGQLVAEYSSDAGSLPSVKVSYLTADHLSSTRVVTDGTGAVVARHDFMPYGEEIPALVARVIGAYGAADGIRQKFTQKERDIESGLDYFLARYYSSAQGRFTGVDNGEPDPRDPQSWHRYKYARNNPLFYVDPDGEADKPAQAKYVNDALATDPTLLETIKAAPNFSQESFENGFNRGQLTGRLTSDPGNKLRGAAGEAIIIDSLRSNLMAGIVGAQPLGGKGPDVGAAFVAGTFEAGGVSVTISGKLGNVALDAKGTTGDVKLSPNVKFASFEVKAGTDTRLITKGAKQVSETATALKSIGGVAVLTVDKGAFQALSAKERTRVFNKVKAAGGYIQILPGFADAARARAQRVIDETRRRESQQ